jgi:hypothetical protein
MGEKALVESQVTDAIRLVQKLDADGDGPSLVAWYFYDDADKWRLLIAGPEFDALLPNQERSAYRKLVEATASLSLSSLSVSDLKLLRTDSPLSLALRGLVATDPVGITRAYFSNTMLNGIFLKEILILRSAPSQNAEPHEVHNA